jgi:hypothetical protein
MRMDVQFDSRGWEQARRRLLEMKLRADNLIPAWDELLDWWARENRKHFTGRGQRWRTPWAPLAPATIAEKVRLGYPTDPLVRTGRMRSHLVSRPLGFERLSQTSVIAGTRLERAVFHQRGTKRMPRRQLVNAAQVTKEQAATSVVRSWIVHGRPTVNPAEALRS